MLEKNIYVPIITPLDEQDNVSFKCVAKLLECVEPYINGVVCCLTSGEGWRLSLKQWSDMVAAVLCYHNMLDVVVGIERATTSEVKYYAELARSIGATSIMLTTPFGQNISQQQMFGHFYEIHESFPGNLWIYHEQPLSGNITQLATLLRIADLPRVCAVKDSSETNQLWDVKEQFEQKGVNLYRGMESQLLVGQGHESNLVSLANLEPLLCHHASYGEVSNDLADEIKAKVLKYNLHEEDWYRYIKQELKRRGVIQNESLIGDREVRR